MIEAYDRLQDPPEILGSWMLAVAALGLGINAVAALILHRGGGESLNVSAALRHVVADLLGSVAMIVAAMVILLRRPVGQRADRPPHPRQLLDDRSRLSADPA